MLQNLLCLQKKTTQVIVFVFHLKQLSFFPYECPGLCRPMMEGQKVVSHKLFPLLPYQPVINRAKINRNTPYLSLHNFYCTFLLLSELCVVQCSIQVNYDFTMQKFNIGNTTVIFIKVCMQDVYILFQLSTKASNKMYMVRNRFLDLKELQIPKYSLLL